MKKILLSTVFAIAAIISAKAQIDPLYAQYLNNPLLINPAYSGLNNNFNASVSFRKQWAGFEGSPVTLNASGHTSLFDNKMGLGLIVLQDKVGNSKNSEVHATYAYRLDLNEKYLSFGLQAGLINFRGNNSDLNLFDPNDPAFAVDQNVSKPSFGAGLILNSERYFIGLSVPRMLKAKTTTGTIQTDLYSQHFYLMGAYVIFLSDNIRLKPSVLLKSVKGAPLSTDLNFLFNIEEKYTAGVFTRNFNTYGVIAQMKLAGAYRFGYTFELPANNSVGTRFTTHELMFGVNLSLFDFHDTSIKNF